MSASAAGDRAEPGRNVRAKSGLNKAILDQGWYEFRRQLAYKLAWRGGILVAVEPRNTSRTCPGCGHVSADNRPTQALFACVACGYSKHADLVGAINMLIPGRHQDVFTCEVVVYAMARLAKSVAQDHRLLARPRARVPLTVTRNLGP